MCVFFFNTQLLAKMQYQASHSSFQTSLAQGGRTHDLPTPWKNDEGNIKKFSFESHKRTSASIYKIEVCSFLGRLNKIRFLQHHNIHNWKKIHDASSSDFGGFGWTLTVSYIGKTSAPTIPPFIISAHRFRLTNHHTSSLYSLRPGGNDKNEGLGQTGNGWDWMRSGCIDGGDGWWQSLIMRFDIRFWQVSLMPWYH